MTKYIEGISNDPSFNLAFEEYVFNNMSKDFEYFMLWQNHNAIIVGKHQNTVEEINTKFVEENGIKVVRRLSGGGAVYHDLGNLNFTFIVNGSNKGAFDFEQFCKPIVKALAKLNVHAEINGRNDITIDGKKFSGNAQYSKKNRIMHHGTLMFNSNLDMVSKSLKVSKDKIQSKGVKSIKSRVTNIADYMEEVISIEEFKKLLLKYAFEETEISEYKLTETDIKAIEKLRDERYDTWEWNYGASPKYNLLKERRFEGCGKIELYIEVSDGIIKGFKTHGDYFGNGDSKELEKILLGAEINKECIENKLSEVDITYYFNNLKKEDFINLILY